MSNEEFQSKILEKLNAINEQLQENIDMTKGLSRQNAMQEKQIETIKKSALVMWPAV